MGLGAALLSRPGLEKVTGADGVAWTRAENRPHPAAGHGIRAAHADPDPLPGTGSRQRSAADAALNLPEEKHSHGLRNHAAIESARGSFKDVAGEPARPGSRWANARWRSWRSRGRGPARPAGAAFRTQSAP